MSPCDYKKYPSNWKEIRAAILARDGYRCKWCGATHHAVGYRERDTGKFVPNAGNLACDAMGRGEYCYKLAKEAADEYNAWDNGLGPNNEKAIVIVLTIAHIDHNEQNNDYGNLASLCQKCHITHDAQQHAQSAKRTRRAKRERGQLKLLEVEG